MTVADVRYVVDAVQVLRAIGVIQVATHATHNVQRVLIVEGGVWANELATLGEHLFGGKPGALCLPHKWRANCQERPPAQECVLAACKLEIHKLLGRKRCTSNKSVLREKPGFPSICN